MKAPIIVSLCLVTIGLMSGCVTGRRKFDLDAPVAGNYPTGLSKGSVALVSISDVRHFENKPSDPSTPSIDGDVGLLSAEQRSTFIGRQRGGFGKAFGDITLDGSQTVQGKVTELLREGLKRRGYTLAPGSDAGAGLMVEIEQFWAWMTPGFFALSFEAQISCKVSLVRHGATRVFHVRGYGLNHGQFAKDVNWQQAYDEAYTDFLAKLDEQLADVGM
jgi:hypothetical protein